MYFSFRSFQGGFGSAQTIPDLDFELIADERLRAVCEARSLLLAREMLVNRSSFPGIADVTAAARKARDWQPDFAG